MAVPEGFERFWETYPRKTAKTEAIKAFEKLKPDENMLNTMINAIDKQKQSEQWTKDGGQFIPHPATWLNQHRWEDELPMAGNRPPLKMVHAQNYTQRQYTESELAGDSGEELLRQAAML